jgi:hypothetical protein
MSEEQPWGESWAVKRKWLHILDATGIANQGKLSYVLEMSSLRTVDRIITSKIIGLSGAGVSMAEV